jgi:hypothetical protein
MKIGANDVPSLAIYSSESKDGNADSARRIPGLTLVRILTKFAVLVALILVSAGFVGWLYNYSTVRHCRFPCATERQLLNDEFGFTQMT